MTFEELYSDYLGIADVSLVSKLASASTWHFLKKGDFLIRTGEEQIEVFFVTRGILRSALQDSDGNDATDCFIWHPGMPAAPSADFHGPSPTSIEALTDCEVVGLKIDVLERLIATNLPIALLQAQLIQKAWQDHWDIKAAIRQKNAHDRYLWFLEAYPGLIDWVSHRHIASFLGMTPVTLSRVRSSIKADQRIAPPLPETEKSGKGILDQ